MVVDMKKIMLCTVESCDRAFHAKKMCRIHYYQVKRKGKVYKTVYDKRPAIIEGNVAKIPLGVEARGGYALVDKEFSYLDKYYWSIGKHGYAHGIVGTDGDVLLHRYVMGLPKQEVDHRDHNKLDNTSANLRVCTPSQNRGNMRVPKTNKTGYKGVKWHVKNHSWIAQIAGNYIGSFKRKEDAARAYNQEAIEKWGDFAHLNEVY